MWKEVRRFNFGRLYTEIWLTFNLHWSTPEYSAEKSSFRVHQQHIFENKLCLQPESQLLSPAVQQPPAHLQPAQMMTKACLIMAVWNNIWEVTRISLRAKQYCSITTRTVGHIWHKRPQNKIEHTCICWNIKGCFWNNLLCGFTAFSLNNPHSFYSLKCLAFSCLMNSYISIFLPDDTSSLSKCFCCAFQFLVSHPNFRFVMWLTPASNWLGNLRMKKKEL